MLASARKQSSHIQRIKRVTIQQAGNSYRDDYSRDSNKCGEGMECQEEFRYTYTNISGINTVSD